MTAIPPPSAARRRPSLQLASAALFGETESPILAAFDSDANRIVLRGGETLFRQGERGDALYVVQLRDPDEPAELTARYRVVEELLGERATNRSEVWAEGPSPLARVLTSVAYGDLVSVYLAILYQTDPTPVTLLSMLKERLARATGGDPNPT